MDRLASELVHRIFTFLPVEDIGNFRLVCKGFSEIGIEYVCSNTQFTFMTNEDLEKLVKLSKQTDIARGVKSLSYAPVTLRPGLSDDQYYDLHVMFVWSYNDLYSIYKPISDEQAEILKRKFDYACLLSALPRFPRLKHMSLYFDGISRQHFECISTPGRRIRRAFEHLFAVKHCGRDHLRTLLQVLSETKVNLESLTIRGADPYFFDWEEIRTGAPFEPISRLKRLDISFDADLWTASDATNGRIMALQHLESGVAVKYLQALPELQTLRVEFYDYWSAYAYMRRPEQWLPIPLNALATHDSVWANLRTLRLEHVKCDRQDIWDLLLRHKGTLREVCLKNMNLQSTSWVPLLDSIRKELYLTKPCICGDICGTSEVRSVNDGDNGEENNEEEVEMEKERWILKRYNGLFELVNSYIMRGGEAEPKLKECPLPLKGDQGVESALDTIAKLRDGDLPWQGWEEISKSEGYDRWAETCVELCGKAEYVLDHN
ncbi:hypothetical protein F5Y04DRAFT_289015 [Hypomontagnella monticulosa]|nr:hypothetical protein F5Y04DRAFT_289015 [Hypomontagnella monticulosa]